MKSWIVSGELPSLAFSGPGCGVLPRDAAGDEALGEIASCGVEVPPDAAQFPCDIKPIDGFVERVKHLLQRIVARTALGV